jgi:hypothetical protein
LLDIDTGGFGPSLSVSGDAYAPTHADRQVAIVQCLAMRQLGIAAI